MRVSVTVIDPRWDLREDVLVDADDATPMRDVASELMAVLASPATGPNVVSLQSRRESGSTAVDVDTLYLAGEPLNLEATLGESGLVEGALLSVGDPAHSLLLEPDGMVEIRLVGGHGAGRVHRLTMGEATIGSDPACVISLPDDRLPPVVAIVSISHDGTCSVRLADGAQEALEKAFPARERPLSLDRELIEDDLAWPVGGQLEVGECLLELEEITTPDAAVEPSPEPGWLDYNRPPRLLPPLRQTKFRLPSPPSEAAKAALPWLMFFVPMIAAGAMVAITKRPQFLIFGLLGPVMILGNYFQTKKQGKRTYRQQLADYRQRKADIEADADEALVEERMARRSEAPDPAMALMIAVGPRARLWERRKTDPDYLSIRIGVGDLPSEVTLDDPEELEHRREVVRTAYDVPVTIPLAERGVIGIAGRDDLPRRIGSWAVAQLAVLQSPRDTQFYVLTDQASASGWEWMRWLPHAKPQNGQDTLVTLGLDTESAARRVAELSALLTARQGAIRNNRAAGIDGPDIVVVFDGARRLRSLPGVVAILKEGPAVGIRSICLDSDERLLPEEASAIVLQTATGVTLRQQRITVVDEVTPDLVESPYLQRVSRALAAIRDISGGDDDAILPAACRLTDVMGIEPPTPDLIKARWSLSPRSTEAVIGISLDGPFAIDMRKDGPHGLIAGTTGAGKSELLQSIVASLAVANRPDGMTFVLVDYKGGAAFKDCVDLPHTVGMVTDLDTHLVERALVSLGAELNRREHILADAGAKDIEDYVDLQVKRPGLPDMPRLLIVIDEFASLARELPDFVTGLVNIAQRGRSLGIHLILATQRPGGVVSPEIRANTNLRIALRVTDGSESSDVIDAPDAGMISKSTPGRAYVRLGAQSLVPFQSGRVGGRRPGAVTTALPTPWMTGVRLTDLPLPVPTKPRAEESTDAEITDLKVLVEAIRQANDQLGLSQQHSPWLPSLTTEVQLDDLLPDVAPVTLPSLPRIPFGVEDLPAQQARRHAAIDFKDFAHLSIVGGPRSGRSQALRTIAASIAQLTSPEDVHVYGLDCGNGALLPLTELPHCGAVVQRTQTDRAVRLFSRLSGELARRQEVLAVGGYADLDEQRASVTPEERLPHIVLLIDRWEGFLGALAELDGGTLQDQVWAMLREGASVGIHLIIAGDRQLVNARMGSLVEDKIALRLPDRQDYGLAGVPPRSLPDDIPEGRGFRSETVTEMQFALLGSDASGQAQAAEVRRIGAAAREAYAAVPRERRPFRVDVLPSRISIDEAWELRPDTTSALWAMVGVGGDELMAHGIDLTRTAAAIIAGPPRSGRSTLLLAMTASLLRSGCEVVVAAPRPSPLRDLEGTPGVRAVLTTTTIGEDDLKPLMDEGNGPVVLVIDDGELLKDVDAKDYLKALYRSGVDTGRAIILGGESTEVAAGFSGWQVDMKGRQGVLINPQQILEGDLIGVRLPRTSVGQQQTAGRVFVNLGDGELRTLQAPIG